MPDADYPWLPMFLMIAVSTGVLLQRAAVISGLFKSPLMARFRMYGPEVSFSPLARFLDAAALWSFLLALILDPLTEGQRGSWGYAPVMFLAMAIMASGATILTRHNERLYEALPRWYAELLQYTTRQERRHIAYAWLRIPRKMRWRLSADQASFRVFVDLVRLTAHYGARAPDDPWAIWG